MTSFVQCSLNPLFILYFGPSDLCGEGKGVDSSICVVMQMGTMVHVYCTINLNVCIFGTIERKFLEYDAYGRERRVLVSIEGFSLDKFLNLTLSITMMHIGVNII